MGPIGTVKSSVVMMLPGTGAISGTDEGPAEVTSGADTDIA